MKKTRKPLKTLLTIVLSLFLVVLLAALVVLFWHFPHYLANQRQAFIAPRQDGEIQIMSYNLRCLTPLDLGEKSWFYRADLIVDDIENEMPAIIGFQEATKWQYDYLCRSLPQYDSIITYRDDSVIAEGCPIFYHTEQYTLVDKGSFWLSETPEVMSKDWGAAHYRICSYVILKDAASGHEFVVFNTHLDHVSDEARIKGIQVILDEIEAFGSLPAIIMGDLNAKEGSATYLSAMESFLDARYAAAETTDSYTYQNWGNLDKSCRIDYFMVSKTGFQIHRYAVLTHTHDGVYSSDHCSITLTVTLE